MPQEYYLEMQYFVVPYVPTGGVSADLAGRRAALAPYEVDGWRGEVGDVGSPNRSRGPGQYHVLFTRHAACRVSRLDTPGTLP